MLAHFVGEWNQFEPFESGSKMMICENPLGSQGNLKDKKLLISSLVLLPAHAVKSSVHKAHFHFLIGCCPGSVCCFM